MKQASDRSARPPFSVFEVPGEEEVSIGSDMDRRLFLDYHLIEPPLIRPVRQFANR
jgi:hypothetical protein